MKENHGSKALTNAEVDTTRDLRIDEYISINEFYVVHLSWLSENQMQS